VAVNEQPEDLVCRIDPEHSSLTGRGEINPDTRLRLHEIEHCPILCNNV
jgi:hypothetical protein